MLGVGWLCCPGERLSGAPRRVTIEWPIETEHVLTDASISHRAWLGQSACNIYADVKEDETREAWGYLTEKQRREANRVADAVDDLWRKRYSGGNRQMTFLDLAEGWL